MAHYAFIDENNIVVEVITGKDETDTTEDWEKHYEQFRTNLRCLRTSYNTLGGEHKSNGVPFRKNYAGIGYSYDEQRDAFIPPKPFPSWILDENTCLWEAPVPRPQVNLESDEFPIYYRWDEDTLSWIEVENNIESS
jgi:hypothetical protein